MTQIKTRSVTPGRSTSGRPAPRTKGKAVVAANALDDLDLLKDSLGYAIKLAQVRTYEMLYDALGPNAISPARMTALSIIANETGISQSVLAARLKIKRPSVVKVVDSLEAIGFIERRPGSDRRSYSLALTARGQAELRQIMVRVRRYDDEIACDLTSVERAQLMKLLARVAVRSK